MTKETVTVKWYCGLYVGKSRWHNTEVWEPSECGHAFTTEEISEAAETGLCATICPRCGGEMTMEDDHPKIYN